MKKRLISLLLSFFLLVGFLPITAKAASGLENFVLVNTYVEGQFADVTTQDWYEKNVMKAYELDLMKGSGSSFNAAGDVTIAEAIVLSCRLHSIYYSDGADFTQGDPWYKVYIDYAIQNGIITNAYNDYMKPISRSEMTVILSNSIPSSEFNEINSIDNGAIPDVSLTAAYTDIVYMFYRAGILTGNDASGRFTPAEKISRSSVAGIITRIVDPSLRKTFTLVSSASDTGVLSSDDIYAMCAPAVMLISTYDVEGYKYARGSGFFIDSTGTAITNYHVIDNAFSMEISTTDGNIYSDVKVLAYSVEHDIAVLKISGSGFKYLSVGDSSKIKGGEVVYAIGNPLGLTSSITDGLISNPSRADYDNFIQISVPISSGNSGGALINEKGEVIGITQGSITNGQNLNFAVPINMAISLPKVTPLSLGEVARLAAIEEYNNIPGAFEDNVNEVEPNNSLSEALIIENGMSVWGVIDDDLLDTYLLRCNTLGTIKIYLFSNSSNTFIDDILLVVESYDGKYSSPEATTVMNDDGSHMLFLSYTIPKAGYYTIDLLSKYLYKYYNLYTDYEFYYQFIPS